MIAEADRAEVFAALADPTRWRVLDVLAARGEGTATTIAQQLPVSRVAVVKHLGVLDRAGLVERRRAGREVRFAVRPQQLDATARWLAEVASAWDARLAAIKRLAEGADGAGRLERAPGAGDASVPGSAPGGQRP